jgi:uncharacterized membrane protein
MTLIPATDNWTLWAIMVAGTAASIWMEGRFRWGAQLSAPVIGMLMAMVLSNTRVVPAEAPAYDFVSTWLVPLALPLLLMRANIVRIARDTGRLFVAFHLAALGTVVGAFVAVWALRGSGIVEIEKAAAIMTGSYIGGMVNFVAVSESARASGSVTTGLIVADNIVMAGVFVGILWMAGSRFFLRHFPHPHTDAESRIADSTDARVEMTVPGLAAALAVAFVIVAFAMGIGRMAGACFPKETPPGSWMGFFQTLATNKYVLITAVSMTAATLFERPLARIAGYEKLGTWLLLLFLFSIGFPADVGAILGSGAQLFALCTIMAVTNLIFALGLGKLLRLDLEDLLLAVNASVGGPPTAAAMAVSRGWSRLVLPGLLAGLWGYIIGTPLGLMVYAVLTR